MPPTPTTRAPSVLGVCGWVSTSRTALPRVYCPLACSLGVSAPPCRVVRHTTMPWSSPQSLSTRPTCAPRGRGVITRPLPFTHGPEASTPSDSALTQAIPASLHAPSRWAVPPAPVTTQAPRHDDAREVHAGWSWGGRAVRDDRPRPQRHRLGVVFASHTVHCFSPPAARAPGRRLRARGLVVPSERLWATQRPRSGGVRAPWTVERRAVRSSAPAGSCHRALVGAAA